MALSQSDIEVLKTVALFYSGKTPGVPRDDMKLNAIFGDDEKAKIEVIQRFSIEVLLPNYVVHKQNIEKQIDTLTIDIAAIGKLAKDIGITISDSATEEVAKCSSVIEEKIKAGEGLVMP